VGLVSKRIPSTFSSEIDDSSDVGDPERERERGWTRDDRERRIDRVAALGDQRRRVAGDELLFMPFGGIEGANQSRSAASSIERRRRATLFESGRGERMKRARERVAATVDDSAKSAEGRQRIARLDQGAGWERRRRWLGRVDEERSRRRYYRRLLEIDARNEDARRTTVGSKEKDKLTERTAGSNEGRNEGGTREEAALFTLRRSRRVRRLVSRRNQQREQSWR